MPGDSPRTPPPGDATLLLYAAAEGDGMAANELLSLVYDQLRRAAQLQMERERPGHTLSATVLVHEAYLKLVGPREVPWRSRAHFYKAAADAMRRILIDHARRRATAKRGGGARRVEDIESVVDLAAGDADQTMALDEAISRLEEDDPDAARVVRLRFYAGLSGDQTAAALGISARQADREWAYARAFLLRALRDGHDASEGPRDGA